MNTESEGETFSINIPIINYGTDSANDLTLSLNHSNEKVSIANSIQEVATISSDSETLVTYVISLSNSAFEAEDLQLELNITDN